jgi:cyclophilin family peptidyl-prolyl cis-trans isomerase
MQDKNSNLIKILLVAIVIISAIYFFTKEAKIEKEEIKVTNDLYEKQNSNSSSTVLGSDNNTNNNQQSSTTINRQKEVAIKKEINNMKTAIIKTNMGEIEVELNLGATPNTAENFKKLASSGFYDGVRFHRVIKDFMIQTGDPQSKDLSKKGLWGTGGPGYKFADELKGDEKYPVGTLAMANSGPNTNGSQFFIVTAQPGYPLPALYTVFGKVTKGLDNALKINETQTDGSDRPIKDVIIESVTVK